MRVWRSFPSHGQYGSYPGASKPAAVDEARRDAADFKIGIELLKCDTLIIQARVNGSRRILFEVMSRRFSAYRDERSPAARCRRLIYFQP